MDDAENLQRALDHYSAQKGGVGLQATVIFPDGVTWTGVSGLASGEKGCPLTLEHHLYTGSITKLYTAALVMAQVEQGAISLDDTLDQWADLPYARGVTVRMLLNHTSGIPDYARAPWFLVRWLGFPSKRWRADELLQVLRGKRLRFEPGSRHQYSNSNYLLLGVILEKVTGKSYEELLHKAIVDSLDLQDTFFLDAPPDLAVANGYDETVLHLGRRNVTGLRRSLVSGAFSAGGILSTSEDVATFVHSLFTGRIVMPSTLAQMETWVEAPDENVPLQTGYGLGVRRLVVGGEEVVGHTGAIPGYAGIAMHNQDKGYTIVILSNLSTIEDTQILADLQDVVLTMIGPR